jgi:hypothetical protein
MSIPYIKVPLTLTNKSTKIPSSRMSKLNCHRGDCFHKPFLCQGDHLILNQKSHSIQEKNKPACRKHCQSYERFSVKICKESYKTINISWIESSHFYTTTLGRTVVK